MPTLRGKTVINLFFEASTRTRTSFEIAAKRLSADAVNISGSTSSTIKGETLLDTARNLEAMAPDVVVLRHSPAGAPHFSPSASTPRVVNAGDGAHEHPTQALLDCSTIRAHKGRLDGARPSPSAATSPTAAWRARTSWRSRKLGAQVRVAGAAHAAAARASRRSARDGPSTASSPRSRAPTW